MKTKWLLQLAFIIWLGFVLASTFVIQKPVMLSIAAGLARFLGSFLIFFLFMGSALVLGKTILERIVPAAEDETAGILLSTGIGMGVLGLLGFGLAALGGAKPVIMEGLLAGVILWGTWSRMLRASIAELARMLKNMAGSSRSIPAWIPTAALLAAGLALLSLSRRPQKPLTPCSII